MCLDVDCNFGYNQQNILNRIISKLFDKESVSITNIRLVLKFFLGIDVRHFSSEHDYCGVLVVKWFAERQDTGRFSNPVEKIEYIKIGLK